MRCSICEHGVNNMAIFISLNWYRRKKYLFPKKKKKKIPFITYYPRHCGEIRRDGLGDLKNKIYCPFELI